MLTHRKRIGGYDPTAREEEVAKNLDARLLDIKESHFYRDVIRNFYEHANTKPKKTKSDKYEELFDISLEGIEKYIDKLQIKVDTFDSPDYHFTKEYRILTGYIGKYQTDLDRINVQGDPEIRARRKKCLQLLDSFIDKLAAKVHEGGRICANCEVKD